MHPLQRAQSELGHALYRLREHEFAMASQTAMGGADLFAEVGAPAGEGLCYAVAAVAYTQQGAIEQAGNVLASASEIARQVGDNGLLATCYEIDADRVSFTGDGEAARRVVQRALEIHQTAQDVHGVVRTRATLSELTYMIGRPDVAGRLLIGVDDALAESSGEPEPELVGRLAGARACSLAYHQEFSEAVAKFDEAVEKLATTTVPCLIGRIAANVAHYLDRAREHHKAIGVLDTGLAFLQKHGNATLEYKLAAARAVFALKAERPDEANQSLARALALVERQRDDPRRVAILQLGIEIAETLEHEELLSQRRLALARVHREQGDREAAVSALLEVMSVESATDFGAAAAELRDILYEAPLNSHPLDWFMHTVSSVADRGDVEFAREFIQERLAMERGADRPYLLTLLAELAMLEGDAGAAGQLYFDAIHQARLHGLPERDRWIARHVEITGA